MTAADTAVLATAQFQDQAVRHEIAQFFAKRSLRAEHYGDHFAELWNTAAECIGGGKLLRPRLLLGAYEAISQSGENDDAERERAIGLAVATEVLHYAFLLHDDVIDGDLIRRGQPNFVGSLLASSRTGQNPARDLHWARSNGILMGDLLLSDAHQLFARNSAPEQMRESLLDALDNAVTESMVGEYLDVALCDGLLPPTLDDVLTMTRLKTATYSFELPLRVGAILAGSSPETQDWLAEIGAALGFAFQLQDDVLSTFGDAAEHGKDAFSDLREGKETAIIAFARASGRWSEIAPRFGDHQLSTGRAEHLRLRLIECGALTAVLTLIDETLDVVHSQLSTADAAITPQLVAFLQRVTDSIEGRHV